MPIKPEGVEKILSGEKTLEIRKTAPKEWVDYLNGKTDKRPEPMTVSIYCTKNGVAVETYCGLGFPSPINGRVGAKFTLKEIEKCVNPFFPKGSFATKRVTYESLLGRSCMNAEQLDGCLGGKGKFGYAWYISDLEIFNYPKELRKFTPICTKKRCNGCKYFGWQHQWDIVCNRPRPLSKAPRSWCYVEESL